MALFLVTALFVSTVHVQSNSECNATFCTVGVNEIDAQYPNNMPRGCTSMAVGYDYVNNEIVIIGGLRNSGDDFADHQLVTFDIENETYADVNQTTFRLHSIYHDGQYYAQINNTLWFIGRNADRILRMDLSTRNDSVDFEDSTYLLPYKHSYGCLSMNDDLLIVAGGFGSLTNVSIYSFEQNGWIGNPPFLQIGRTSPACAISNGHFYVIGGASDNGAKTEKSIEKLTLNNIGQGFMTLNATLSQSTKRARAIARPDSIIVVGGSRRTIEVIDTFDDTVSVQGELMYEADAPGVVKVNETLYIFGGNLNAPQYQYIIVERTKAPTNAPTVSPSPAPSNYPTNEPSFIPSPAPSFSPTYAPSDAPTQHPTRFPTKTDSYTHYVGVEYVIFDYKESDSLLIENNTKTRTNDVGRIIEHNYLSEVTNITYRSFWLQINEVMASDINALTLAASILCINEAICLDLGPNFKDTQRFDEKISEQMREYFNVSRLDFRIRTSETTKPSPIITQDESFDLVDIYQIVLVSFAFFGLFLVLFAYTDARFWRKK